MEGKNQNIEQNIHLINRGHISLNDCMDVHNFNEENVLLQTSLGLLSINGEELRIEKLNLDSGEISINGNIYALCFEDDMSYNSSRGGFLSRMFK